MGRWIMAIMAVMTVCGGLLLAMAFVGSDSSNGTVVTLDEGPSPLVIDGVALVAVRDGDDVWIFLGGDRRRELLGWCEASQVFTTSQGASIFALDGEKLAGPSPAPELDQVRVALTSSGDYRIWPDDILPSRPWPDGTVIGDPWQPRTSDNWLERFQQPASYCPRPEDVPPQRPG